MNPNDPLSQLRDIHLPAAVGWWPPAPGWWLLTLLVITALAAIGYWLHWRYKKAAYRREAQTSLMDIRARYRQDRDAQQLLSALSALLKRTAITCYGRDEIAGLAGQSWLEFLDRTGNTAQFSTGCGQILAQRFAPLPQQDCDPLLDAVEHWLKKHS